MSFSSIDGADVDTWIRIKSMIGQILLLFLKVINYDITRFISLNYFIFIFYLANILLVLELFIG